MVNEVDTELVKRQRFELMAVRLANHLDLANCDDFEKLPGQIKTMFNSMKYVDVVFPLMQKDKEEFGLSYRQLEIKYGVPKSTIQLYFSAPKKK